MIYAVCSRAQSLDKTELLAAMQSAIKRDLRVPPGNRLEALKGGRKGQHSIRVNQQWRVCCRLTESDPAGWKGLSAEQLRDAAFADADPRLA